ncbi:MAG: hypothetical protein OHK0024_24880 [Thalassobaculales bacterium]
MAASVERLRRARAGLAAEPGAARFWLELAEADPALGAALCRRLLGFRPDSAAAWSLLGRLTGEASALREALRLDPADHRAALALAAVLEDPAEAVGVLQSVVRRRPDCADLQRALGLAWQALGENAKAAAAFRAAGDGRAEALAAAPAAAITPAYVRRLFDGYAAGFDEALLGRLGYRAPALVAALAAAHWPAGAARLLDLGCGTGLAVEALAARADVPGCGFVAGIDLSPAMLARAAAKRQGARPLYDALAAADLLAIPCAGPWAGDFDVILAVDVLCYIADLRPVFAAAAARLAPGGLLVVTVEEAAEAGAVLLRPSRRYAHGAALLRQAAAACGLGLAEILRAPLRRERGEDVDGLVAAFAPGIKIPGA